MKGSVRLVVRQAPAVEGIPEWLVYAEVPAAGGDAALIAVYETELAANYFARAWQKALDSTLATPATDEG